MNRILFILCFLISFISFGQTDDNPIKIETSIKKISNTEYDVIFNAKLFKGWYLYSQYNPDEASLPLVISIAEGETGYNLKGILFI
ncbi:MAG: hypothetical protein P8P88_10745, partial [Polaribacter sp.]|nr:hypothetical protein [Polaribacter sp.]